MFFAVPNRTIFGYLQEIVKSIEKVVIQIRESTRKTWKAIVHNYRMKFISQATDKILNYMQKLEVIHLNILCASISETLYFRNTLPWFVRVLLYRSQNDIKSRTIIKHKSLDAADCAMITCGIIVYKKKSNLYLSTPVSPATPTPLCKRENVRIPTISRLLSSYQPE